MFQRKQNTPIRPARVATSGQRFLESEALTTNLPKTLLTKPNGQLFQEIQIGAPSAGQNLPNMVQQMEMLQRAEPVGGWELVVNENQELIFERTLQKLEKRLAEPGRSESVKALLAEIEDAGEKLKRELDEQRRQIEARYDQVQAPLRRWQDEYGREQDLINRVLTLAQALLGGQLSVSEVVKLWNKRESLAKARDAFRAASELVARFSAAVEEYARNLDAVILGARQGAQDLEKQIQELVGDLNKTRLWSFQTDYARVADALTSGEDVVLLAEALAALREQGSDKLLEVIAKVSRREAERELAYLDIVRLIEKEAAEFRGGTGLDDLDPVILVGENLLDQVRHQNPTWQLARHAHPRTIVLEITPNGENVYDHPGLQTARYGDRVDRLGFLEAQMDVALDEIQIIRDGADAFQQERLKREYFILEEVVKHWDAKPAQPAAAPLSHATPDVALSRGDGDGIHQAIDETRKAES